MIDSAIFTAMGAPFSFPAAKKSRYSGTFFEFFNCTAVSATPAKMPPAVAERPPGVARAPEMFEPVRTPAVDRAAFERAERLVRQPAIFMIVVGALSLTVNLMTAGIGYIDEFVVTLGIKPARDNPMRGAPDGSFGDRATEPGRPDSDRGTTVLGIIGILFFAFASAVAIWSGYNMLGLRNYGLALAGSVALVPGSCTCCLLGLPSGIWSLAVLLNPEVRAVFR